MQTLLSEHSELKPREGDSVYLEFGSVQALRIFAHDVRVIIDGLSGESESMNGCKKFTTQSRRYWNAGETMLWKVNSPLAEVIEAPQWTPIPFF